MDCHSGVQYRLVDVLMWSFYIYIKDENVCWMKLDEHLWTQQGMIFNVGGPKRLAIRFGNQTILGSCASFRRIDAKPSI